MTVKLYDNNAYQTECSARVISADRIETEESILLDVVLDQTVFFPEEGGQTPDRGIISMDDAEGNLHFYGVQDVQIKNEVIHHYVSAEAAAFLLPGTAVSCSIDWEHRFDNMQNHSGEHIFSGLVHSMYGYNNVGFHLSESTVSMDYDGPLTKEQVRILEDEANRIIFSNRPILCEYPSEEVLAVLDYRSKKELDSAVRIVTIPDCDVCACCAPHVASTAEIGILKVTKVISYKGGVRLNIVCGSRALADYQNKQTYVEDVMNLLSLPGEEIASGVSSKLQELVAAKQTVNSLMDQLLNNKIDAMDEALVSPILFTDGMDMIRIRNAVNRLTASHSGYCGIFNKKEDGYSYIIGSSSENCRDLQKQLSEKLNARGGGKPEMIQGSTAASEEEIRSFFQGV